MDLSLSPPGAILCLAALLVIPSVITSLQVLNSIVSTVLLEIPILVVVFSALYYVIMVLLPVWARVASVLPIHPQWFLMLIFLYLLWSTLFYTVGTVLWAYLVLTLTLLLSIFVLRMLYLYTPRRFFAVFLITTLWLLYLFTMETVALFQGMY
jgi:hypothetical protein